jgi:hypothetical protein
MTLEEIIRDQGVRPMSAVGRRDEWVSRPVDGIPVDRL